MIFLVILLVVLWGLFFISTQAGTGTVTNTDNNKESVKKTGTASQSSDTILKKTLLEQTCYGITVKFPVRKVKEIKQCSLQTLFDLPFGSLVVDYRENEGSTVSTDVLMRQANPEKYASSKISLNEKEYLLFKNQESINYEKTAYLQLAHVTIGITLKPDSPKNFDREFEEILTSFYCKNECKSDTLDSL